MASTEDPRDVGLAIILLRSLPHPRWNQAELSRRSGIEKALISDYEQGKATPGRKNRQRIAAAAGVDVSFFEQLIPVCRGIRIAWERAAGQGPGLPETDPAPSLEQKIARAVQEGMTPILFELAQQDRGPSPCAEDRGWAEETWSKMKPLAADDQSLTVDVLLGDDRTWALAETLCLASEPAAAGRPKEALRLARLAVRLAEHCPGAESWRLRLRGWCEPFLAHALRAGGDLAAAERTFMKADALWRQGAAGDPAGLLERRLS